MRQLVTITMVMALLAAASPAAAQSASISVAVDATTVRAHDIFSFSATATGLERSMLPFEVVYSGEVELRENVGHCHTRNGEIVCEYPIELQLPTQLPVIEARQSEPGLHDLTVTLRNDDGVIAQDTQTITVEARDTGLSGSLELDRPPTRNGPVQLNVTLDNDGTDPAPIAVQLTLPVGVKARLGPVSNTGDVFYDDPLWDYGADHWGNKPDRRSGCVTIQGRPYCRFQELPPNSSTSVAIGLEFTQIANPGDITMQIEAIGSNTAPVVLTEPVAAVAPAQHTITSFGLRATGDSLVAGQPLRTLLNVGEAGPSVASEWTFTFPEDWTIANWPDNNCTIVNNIATCSEPAGGFFTEPLDWGTSHAFNITPTEGPATVTVSSNVASTAGGGNATLTTQVVPAAPAADLGVVHAYTQPIQPVFPRTGAAFRWGNYGNADAANQTLDIEIEGATLAAVWKRGFSPSYSCSVLSATTARCTESDFRANSQPREFTVVPLFTEAGAEATITLTSSAPTTDPADGAPNTLTHSVTPEPTYLDSFIFKPATCTLLNALDSSSVSISDFVLIGVNYLVAVAESGEATSFEPTPNGTPGTCARQIEIPIQMALRLEDAAAEWGVNHRELVSGGGDLIALILYSILADAMAATAS